MAIEAQVLKTNSGPAPAGPTPGPTPSTALLRQKVAVRFTIVGDMSVGHDVAALSTLNIRLQAEPCIFHAQILVPAVARQSRGRYGMAPVHILLILAHKPSTKNGIIRLQSILSARG